MVVDPVAMTADQLLKLRAFELFPKEAGATELYHQLARSWHPDINRDPNAGAVFAHVTSSFQAAKQAWIHGTYPNTLTIIKSTGVHHYAYLSATPFELGELYVCERHVIWAARRENDDLARRWLDVVKTYKYPNEKLRERMPRYVPRNSHTVANGDRAYTIVDRPADYIRVADILAKKGPLDPRHVAWIMSRAYHIASFLEYNGFKHADISPESFFIEPSTHLGALLGGWFYTAMAGQKLLAAPARTAHLLKVNNPRDAQIRLMGRRMLGATSAYELRQNKDAPEQLRTWLLGTPYDKTAEANYQWQKTLIAAFGEKRFTELKLTTPEIYST